jgi:hypothetical protein
MNKKLIVLMTFVLLTFSGCSTLMPPKMPVIQEKKVWWGTKAEIKAFLDSPNAKAERWFIESLGGDDVKSTK